MIVFIILAIVLSIIGLFALYWARKFNKGIKTVVKCFEDGNVLVYGLKGDGKDVTFNKVINYRKKNCYANVLYNKEYCVERSIEEFSIEPNTFESFVSGDFTIVKKNNKENTDFYISDAGACLPSQLNNILIKKYPSFPAYYALVRHLTNSNIHMNSQNLMRVWDKLREHTAYFIRACGTKKLFNMLITRLVIYDNIDAAKAKLEPYKATGLIKRAESRANEEQFKAQNGRVEEVYICQFTKNIHYDSRWAHRKIYGVNSPTSN